MITGMKFHIKGPELKTLFEARAAWYLRRANDLELNLKQAEVGMKAASDAALAAGPAGSNYSLGGGLEVMSLGSRRNPGGNMEDPVAAIKSAIAYANNRVAAFSFYAAHLIVEATYELSESDVTHYELLEI
jgi:hypothetical protein